MAKSPLMNWQGVEKFGTKMMIGNRNINNVPNEYLFYALNSRIVNGAIRPRKGFTEVIKGNLYNEIEIAFVLEDRIYAIINGVIYWVDEDLGRYINVATLPFDSVGSVAIVSQEDENNEFEIKKDFAVIAAPLQKLWKFDPLNAGTVLEEMVNSATNDGFVAYAFNRLWVSRKDRLYVSGAYTPSLSTPTQDFSVNNLFDFRISEKRGQQRILLESNCKAIHAASKGVYIFTKTNIAYVDISSLQTNVSVTEEQYSIPIVLIPLGDGEEALNNRMICSEGDVIFYMTKNKSINAVNYGYQQFEPGLGEISNIPVVGFTEVLEKVRINERIAFAINHQGDDTIQFFLGDGNNTIVVYDHINKTWTIDSGKDYAYMVKRGSDYYGFKIYDNTLYLDNYGYGDNGNPINFRIITQQFTFGDTKQKTFRGFEIIGGISRQSKITCKLKVDQNQVWSGEINKGNYGEIAPNVDGEIGNWDVAGHAISGGPIPTLVEQYIPFDQSIDAGGIWIMGKRIQLEVQSTSQFQDFSLEQIFFCMDYIQDVDISDVF